MRILLDTHILLWSIAGDERLPAAAASIILDPDNWICYSPISVWEVAIMHEKHPRQLILNEEQLVHYCQEAGYVRVDLSDRHVLNLGTLRYKEGMPPHSDPFDRMLIAQAKADGMLLLTHDQRLSGYEERCVFTV